MIRSISFPFLLLLFHLAQCQKSAISPADYFSATQIAAANTAINVSYITDEEKDIFLYCNLSRMYPRKFYQFYEAYLDKDDRLSLLTSEYYHRTLGEELQSMEAMDALFPDREMYDLAECWAVEAGQVGSVGHDRVTCVGGFSGECCSYGWDSGLEIVFQLLIDQGVESLDTGK